MAEEKLSLAFLELTYESPDGSTALVEFIEKIANKKLLDYKQIIHRREKRAGEKDTRGKGKEGESLFTHIINLCTLIEQVRPVFSLSGEEMCCLLMALVMHDLNKVPTYNKSADGKPMSYVNAASKQHIADALADMDVDMFFPQWRDYLNDIIYLAHSHQEGSETALAHDQRHLNLCQLDQWRLTGPLKELMKAADVADNSHSGEYNTWHEKHIRDKLLGHINAALDAESHARRYRFVGHRLAEQRGLLTNAIHNVIVRYMRERSEQLGGQYACIDLLYHPEGVDYLLDKQIALVWSRQDVLEVARQIGEKFASLQLDQVAQFIKAKPSGITVDTAAMESGATLEDIFTIIQHTVENKRYRLEWRAERNTLVRADLETALHDEQMNDAQKEQLMLCLRKADLVPTEDDTLKRGEFLAAYRNFLKDHRAEQLKAIKEDAWKRAAQLFQVAETAFALALFVDPYRRGYFLADALAMSSLDAMREAVLADVQQLEQQALQAQAERKGKQRAAKTLAHQEAEQDETKNMDTSLDLAYIVDYLERNLEVWDSIPGSDVGITHERPVAGIDFGASLRRYADAKRPHAQCCYCGSALPAEEWMAIQVPASVGVQSFSNRLEAGSMRDPKRNVCPICRVQFILEKLAWQAHRDKQGNELVTFYLHLFPYSFFTQPLLQAWWQTLQAIRDHDHKALFLDTKHYFLDWQEFRRLNKGLPVRYYKSFNYGTGIPALSESLSNTPVLPLHIPGAGYGKQFLTALEMATLMAQWFDCRVLLSRMPIPPLNLANEYIGNEPVALQVETPPRVMNWLLPKAALTRREVEMVCEKLSVVHQLVQKLGLLGDEKSAEIIYDLVTAPADEPLALYYEVDRLIEQQAAQQRKKKGLKPEYQALMLTQQIAPYLERLREMDNNATKEQE